MAVHALKQIGDLAYCDAFLIHMYDKRLKRFNRGISKNDIHVKESMSDIKQNFAVEELISQQMKTIIYN